MRWPWQRRETRADSSYTDALVAAITANASGQSTAFPTATAALEACAGFVGRAFAAAEVSAPAMYRDALDPACMALIGRALVRRGELVLFIDVMDGELRLLPCQTHDVDGDTDPSTWTYRCTLGGPSRTRTYEPVPAAGVVHVAYARDPETPWRGYGPLQVALLAGRLSAETVAALADETSGPRGHLLPVPVDGADPTVTALKQDLKNLKGKAALVQGGDWDNTGTGGMASWKPNRIGSNPPDALVKQADLATREVYAACGINPAIFQDAQGTAAREAYRQALFGLIAPLGRLVAAELSEKLEAEISLDWTELRASDIAGRARAFQSLVGGGMDVAKAAALSGLVVTEEP